MNVAIGSGPEQVPSSGADSSRARLATRVAFFAAGAAMSSWAPLVPLAQARTRLDAGTLGVVLLCFGCGSLTAMPIAGIAAARFGTRRVVLAAVGATCVALPCLAVIDQAGALAVALFVFGAGLGALDVSMNLLAIAVERAAGRAMMSGFHALFSLGGIVGASGVAAALSLDAGAAATTVVMALALAAAVASTMQGVPDATGRDRTTTFVMPHGAVIVLGLLAAIAFLVEGAVLDWSAIFLSTVRDVPVARAAAGYVAFSIAMTAGRFAGDRVVQRLGARTTLVVGAVVSACGLAIVAAVPDAVIAIAGFALVGIGSSNIAPVLFTNAGRQTAMAESLAVPAMTTLGYAGLLAGPAVIGFVAHATSLVAAFALLSAAMACVALVGRRSCG